MSSHELTSRLEFAVAIARAAGEHTLQYFQARGVGYDRKSDRSPVTIADREAEQLLRARIAASFPQDGILGEEFGEQPGVSGYRWILDPVDGTKTFITGVPLYSTLIGLEQNGESLLGVIEIPALNERVYAARGCGAWHVQRDRAAEKARVSERASLAEGIFLTSQVDSFSKRGAHEAFAGLEKAAYVTRTWGDGYGYLLVATGRAEAMVDPAMNLWDAAAIAPILAEAGGTFTDWMGRATIHGGEGVATNSRVLDEVLRQTRPFASV